VITFDYTSENLVGGDIFISTDRVKNNSVIFNQNHNQEMVRVVSHGLLHLLHYNDKEAEEIKLMRAKEESMLHKYNLLLLKTTDRKL
jgi:rRNA maturation RNase YbeY